MQKAADQPLERLGLWIDTVPREGPGQMACDEALLESVDRPVMRVFRWWRPWVSIGYFVAMDEAKTVRPDLPVCRRWTGGGIVVHEGDFTFSLSVPKVETLASLRPAASYRGIHAALVEAMQHIGWKAELAGAAAKTPGECFAAPVEHDVIARGSKIAGGAQRRTRNGLLHQGSVQTKEPLEPGFGMVLARTLSASVEPWTPPSEFEERVRRLTAAKYASPRFLRGPARAMNFTGTTMS